MYFRDVFFLMILAIATQNFGDAQSVVCPAVRTTSGWLDLFPLPCKKNSDCIPMGAKHLCCKGFCTKGVKKSAPLRTSDQSSKISVVPLSSSSSSTTTTTTASTTSTTTTTTTTTPSTTSTTTTTTTTTPSTTTTSSTTPEPPRPFLQILPIQSTLASAPQPAKAAPAKVGKSSSSRKLVCPKPGQSPVVLFPIPCEKHSQCRASGGADQVCCEKRCVRGVSAPKPAPTHQPLLGVIPRDCPSEPLGELLFEVQACTADAQCWPRVCCPDGKRSYCRTARARLDLVPVARQINGPVRMIEKYLQCTAPPQYDLFPQPCSSSVDCFPNLCCAEGGKKHCRPPQRSLLALLAGVTQRVGSTIGSLRQTPANQNKV